MFMIHWPNVVREYILNWRLRLKYAKRARTWPTRAFSRQKTCLTRVFRRFDAWWQRFNLMLLNAAFWPEILANWQTSLRVMPTPGGSSIAKERFVSSLPILATSSSKLAGKPLGMPSDMPRQEAFV